MAAITTSRGEMAGILWREYHLSRVGDQNQAHKHEIDHATFLARGSVRVEIGGKLLEEFKAPTLIDVKAGLMHQFTALEDDTVYFCMFNADRMRQLQFAST